MSKAFSSEVDGEQVVRTMNDDEREAQEVADWLDGKGPRRDRSHDGPSENPEAKKVEISVEVGERADPNERRELRDAPGITVIETDEEDIAEKKGGGYTVLTPGRRKDTRY